MESVTGFASLDDYLAEVFAGKSDAPAVANAEEVCSWRRLSERMEAFAHRYGKMAGLDKNIPLVLHGHKEIDFVVAMYACLFYKIPFVPVDSIYPEGRLKYICGLSKAQYLYRAQGDTFEKICDEAEELDERDLAYIMFTSGTTGQPKGVQIGRESVFNLMQWMKSQLDLSAPNVFMNHAPFAFDLSMYEVFGNLAYRGCMVLNSRQDIANPSSWVGFLAQKQISTWVSTPSFALQQLLNPKLNGESVPSLKEFLFCGEKLGKQVVKMIFQKFPDARVINTYGPTEATVATTCIDITREMLDGEDDLPVGSAVLNSHLQIVDEEIWIGGINVMRGYLNNDAENAKRLIVGSNGERIYKTGDYGFEKDGVFYVQGRRDEQIKLNGYRIELSEIEEKILALKSFGLENAAVVALKRDNGAVARLVCFYTSQTQADPVLLKEALADKLPPYMMPSEFIQTARIPVSTNHKTDKKALLQQYQDGMFS